MNSNARVIEADVSGETIIANYLEDAAEADTIALVVPAPETGGESSVIGADAIDFVILLREQASEKVEFHICGQSDNLHYSQLNSIILDIGTYALTGIGVPVFVTVLGSWISEKIRQYNSEDIELRVSIVKRKGKEKKKYVVSGKPKDVLKAVRALEKNEQR